MAISGGTAAKVEIAPQHEIGRGQVGDALVPTTLANDDTQLIAGGDAQCAGRVSTTAANRAERAALVLESSATAGANQMQLD